MQDAFHDNFVIQWHPESLRTIKVSISRSRVYLIDFETAVQFPAVCPSIERVSVGCPVAENYFLALMHLSLLLEKHIVFSSWMFGNWAKVFLISKYGTVYLYSIILLLTDFLLLRAPF